MKPNNSWEIELLELSEKYDDYYTAVGLDDVKKLITKTLQQQREEDLLEYFEQEDNLIDKYANLKDDNWDKFLEARSKLKIKNLKQDNK